MAIITEEQETPQSSKLQKRRASSTPKPTEKPTSQSPPKPKTPITSPNPFAFWFHFTVVVSLITLVFVSLSNFSPQDPKAWFLSLPAHLRQHYSKGRTIKVQTALNHPPIEVFTIQEGPVKSENVLIVHGFGCSSYTFRQVVKSLGLKGIHTVAVDLPGSGFSDKSMVVMKERPAGVFERLGELYNDIQEKGLFWGFDELVEKGYVNYEENGIGVSERETVEAIELGPEEMSRVLGQVIDTMGLAPVDLVFHDSALGLAANWVSENPGSVRSVTLLDTTSKATALPLWVLGVPIVRELVLGFRIVFEKVLELCCSQSVVGLDVEAHRLLLKGRDGRKALVGMGNKLNCSFDLVEWGSSEGVKGLPIQVIWSSGSSKEWTEEGRNVANALPQASFVTHSGGRWPQEDALHEVSETIFQFLSTLPKQVRQSTEEPIPEHIQKLLNEAKHGEHQNHQHGRDYSGHEHNYDHAHAGYADAYGLGHGRAS